MSAFWSHKRPSQDAVSETEVSWQVGVATHRGRNDRESDCLSDSFNTGIQQTLCCFLSHKNYITWDKPVAMKFARNEVFPSNVAGKDQKELSSGNKSTPWFIWERPMNRSGDKVPTTTRESSAYYRMKRTKELRERNDGWKNKSDYKLPPSNTWPKT